MLAETDALKAILVNLISTERYFESSTQDIFWLTFIGAKLPYGC